MNFAVLLAFACALLGGALAFSAARNSRRALAPVSFALGMTALAAESVFSALSWDAAGAEEVMRWQSLRLWAVSFLPGVWFFFSLSYGRGNHREFLARWKFFLAALFILPPALAVFFSRNFFALVPSLETGRWLLSLGQTGFALSVIFLITIVLVLMNLERTFRASVGTMRWRIKFMLIGLMVLFCVRGYTTSQTLLTHVLDPRLQAVDCGGLFIACLLMLRSFFREGHFDLDVYPSHSVLQSSLTIVLAGIYFLVIGVIFKIVSALGGGMELELKAFIILAAVVLLAVFLLSDRVRLRSRQFVSRHFQRPLYDYRTVWRRFTEATATCVSQAELCQAAVKSVSDIFQTLSVTIWLVDEKKEKLFFSASTALSPAAAAQICPPKNEITEMLRHLQNHHEPVDIDAAIEPWVATLRQCHPEKFQQGANRVCVPMIASDALVGFMILGDRVGALEFSWQDFDLLKCIGDQIAAGLLNTRLSQKILQAKELEAFQTMSAFFVHDLKNTANTLNLMLQNLPVHFDDPQFRADALRGVSKTVAHINRLIGRLGSIRSELQIKPVESDLNELIAKALAGWEEVAGVHLKKEFSALPKISVDPEQFLKVATNLIFNAREAVAANGEVTIQTSAQSGQVVFSVSDNGCGMSRDFLERQLFRAFQTTKKSGLGIGMFQSKMIVEAHRGRIEVESEPGKGSTFRVLLPLDK